MRSAQLVEPNRLEIRSVPVPRPGVGEVLIRVRAVGICGSDVNIFRGDLQKETVLPYVLGHEFSGEVAAIGPGVEGVSPGDRVACAPDRPCGQCEWCSRGEANVCPHVRFAASHGEQGCLCDYYVVHHSQVYLIPPTTGLAEAAVFEPVAIGLHVVENLLKPTQGDLFAIMGAGPDGLAILAAARENGAGRVYVSDLVPERLEAATRIGADGACDVSERDFVSFVRERTDGRGVDCVVEATGSPAAICQVVHLPAIHGRAVVLGIPPVDAIELDMAAARRKELTVTWARRTVGKYARALELIASSRANTDVLITHRFPLEQVQSAFECVRDRRDGVLKAVVLL
jgi:L-iditol 2-dehydrogenase